MSPIIWRLLVARAHYRLTGESTPRTGLLANHISGKTWFMAEYRANRDFKGLCK